MIKRTFLIILVLVFGMIAGGLIVGRMWRAQITRDDVSVVSLHLEYLSLLRNGQLEDCIRRMEKGLVRRTTSLIRARDQIAVGSNWHDDEVRVLSLARSYLEYNMPSTLRSKSAELWNNVTPAAHLGIDRFTDQLLPQVKIQELNGNGIEVSSLRGLVLIEFWASWCQPCKRVSHVLNEVKHWASRQDIPLSIMSVNYGEDENTVRLSRDEMGITVPVYLDLDMVLAKSLGVESLPTFLIVKDGKVIAANVGVLRDLKTWLIAELEKSRKGRAVPGPFQNVDVPPDRLKDDAEIR